MKVSVVGAGMVGATTALRLLEDRTATSLALIDVVEGLPQAVALDLAQSAPLRGHTIDIVGSSDYGPTEGSDLVIITAGLPRKPGQSRSDLLATNSEIVAGVTEEVSRRSPNAILIIVTNPLDEMTTLAWKASGFASEKVVGMAGELDTSRYRYFIAAELGVHPDQVDAIVLGSHGETMVPLPRLTNVAGRPLTSLLPASRVEELVERTRNGGAEIVALLPRGSAWMAPSASIADMATAIAGDERRVVSACAYLRGEYGLTDVYLGVPARLGGRGVIEVVELSLTDEEMGLMKKAADTVRSRVAALGFDGPSPDPGPLKKVTPSQGTRADERGGGLDSLRQESRVRRAVNQVLWERGAVTSDEIESLTRAVLERMQKK